MKLIPISKGKYYSPVDDEDYDYFMQWKWRAKLDKNTIYAIRDERLPNGKTKKHFLHRDIMKAVKGEIVDHKDGDGLNNVKDNLRTCTNHQNCMNIRVNSSRKNKTSKLKGVHFCSRSQRFVAQIMLNGKGKHLGYFDNEEEAGRAYNEKAKELFGEFACLNILDSE